MKERKPLHLLTSNRHHFQALTLSPSKVKLNGRPTPRVLADLASRSRQAKRCNFCCLENLWLFSLQNGSQQIIH